MKKYLNWLIALGILLVVGFWGYKSFTKPLPGEAVKEKDGTFLSREHLTDIAEIIYASNPPAGGKHFPIWAKPGVYDRFISDGYLIHSMEHGYIIVWYDCSKLSTGYHFVPSVLAHGDEEVENSTESGLFLMHMTATVASGTSWITPENPPAVEVELPDSFKTEACKSLVSDLSAFAKVAQRVIVVPKMNMETPIALTAWERILKLQNVDQEAIESFINAFHNRGPEQTTE